MLRALRLIAGGFGLLCLLATTAAADVPHTLNFQGRLLDSTGTPYSGSKLVKFSIYDSLGTEIWTSGFSTQTFSGGLVNVPLGAPPQPALPTAALQGDTSLTLGITVDTDPEITPRIKLSSAAWAIHAGDADRVDGLEGSSFVQEGGDTMSGSLAVLGNLSVGTDSSISPVTIQSQDKWRWDIGDGWGDLRLGNNVMGFNIGIALAGGGAGATRMWTRGGFVEDIYFGGPTNGDLLRLKGNLDEVEVRGHLFVGSGNGGIAPLTVQSENQYRWDVGTGLGDFRLVNGAAGLSIGMNASGQASIWSSGGALERISFGGPTNGELFRISSSDKTTSTRGTSYWTDTLGAPRVSITADGSLSTFGGDGTNNFSLFGNGTWGTLWVNDSGQTSVELLGKYGGGQGAVFLYRKRPIGLGRVGISLLGGADSVGAQMSIHDGVGDPKITFNAEADSDLSVVLPAASINHTEILDEPGIAFTRLTTNIIGLTKSATSQNFTSVNITTPADGYIVVDGVGNFSCTGDGAAFGWIQISETSNRAQETGQFNWVGPTGFGNTSSSYIYHSIPIKRFYFKPRGTYTFYLQGNAWTGNAVTSGVNLLAPTWLQATYYPVSYGTASTLAESPGDFESATPVAVTDPQTGETVQTYQVDLRELELKAARARVELEKAQRELLEAKLTEHMAVEAELQQAHSASRDNDR